MKKNLTVLIWALLLMVPTTGISAVNGYTCTVAVYEGSPEVLGADATAGSGSALNCGEVQVGTRMIPAFFPNCPKLAVTAYSERRLGVPAGSEVKVMLFSALPTNGMTEASFSMGSSNPLPQDFRAHLGSPRVSLNVNCAGQQ